MELNRRLTDRVYLGVIGIIRRNGEYYFEDDPDSETITQLYTKIMGQNFEEVLKVFDISFSW